MIALRKEPILCNCLIHFSFTTPSKQGSAFRKFQSCKGLTTRLARFSFVDRMLREIRQRPEHLYRRSCQMPAGGMLYRSINLFCQLIKYPAIKIAGILANIQVVMVALCETGNINTLFKHFIFASIIVVVRVFSHFKMSGRFVISYINCQVLHTFIIYSANASNAFAISMPLPVLV